MRAAVVLILLAPALAGCVNPAPELPEPLGLAGVFDVAGDAPAFLDVLSGRFIETREAVAVEIQVARLDEETISNTLRENGAGAAWIFLCWRQGAVAPPEWVRAAASVDKIVAPDTECAGVEIFPAETMPIIGQYISYHGPTDGCNAYWFCAWRLPHTIESGSPATIRIAIPRELLYNASVGENLEKPHLESGIWPSTPNDQARSVGRSVDITACVDAVCVPPEAAGPSNMILDKSEFGSDYVLQLPTKGTLVPPPDPILLHDSEGDLSSAPTLLGDSPQVDVLTVELEETATQAAWIIHVASLPERPSHAVWLQFGVDDSVYSGSYEVVAGQVTQLSGSTCDAVCDERTMNPELSFKPGTPGTIRFAFSWKEMNHPQRGDRVNYAELFAVDGRIDRARGTSSPAGDVFLRADLKGEGDPVFPGEPYWLRIGAAGE